MQPFFTYLVGAFIIIGGLLLSQGVAAASRKQSTITVLTSCLLALFASLIQSNYVFTSVPQSAGVSLLLPVIAALCLALPLLDRTRHTGIIFATALGGLVLVNVIYTFLPPHLPTGLRIGLPRILILAAVTTSILGGMKLALHPSRHTANGDVKYQAVPSALLLAGWASFAAGLMLLTTTMMGNVATIVPMGVSALTAALVVLLVSDARDALHKTGEALLAGMLMVIAVPMSFELCILLGFIAGFFVTRSESIASSLRIDDPLHFIGALLIPSFLGILMQGIVFDTATLSDLLQWIGGALIVGGVLALVLWPLTAFLFGFAAKLRPTKAKSKK